MVKSAIVIMLLIVVLLTSACSGAGTTPTPLPVKPTPTESKASAAAPAPTSTPAPPPVRRGGRVTAAVFMDFLHFDPVRHASGSAYFLFKDIYDPLLQKDDKGTLLPSLAEKWDVGTDGKSITFYLRKGVKFQDGTDFDADAVKAHFDRVLTDQKRGGSNSTMIAPVASAEKVDAYTVRLLLKRPAGALLWMLAAFEGSINSPTAVAKWGLDEYGRHPVGTGPFQVTDIMTGDHVTLKRFPGYWQKGIDGSSLPYLDEVVVKPIEDDTVRLVNLRAGSLDMVQDVPPKDIKSLRESKEFVLQDMPFPGNTSIGFRLDRPPFDNKFLRQAITSAIDRKGIIRAVHFDAAYLAEQFVTPDHWSYNPNVKQLPYDKEKAKQFLKEAGKPDGFSFTLHALNWPVKVQEAEIIKANLAEVGIKANVVLEETTQLIARKNKKDYEALLSQTSYDDPAMRMGNNWASEAVRQGGNTSGYNSPSFDEGFRKQETGYTLEERKQGFGQMHKALDDDASDLFLLHPLTSFALRNKLQGFQVSYPDVLFHKVWLKE